MIVRKELMRPSEDQPKLNRRLNEHVWHALWHALGDITGKTGPFQVDILMQIAIKLT